MKIYEIELRTGQKIRAYKEHGQLHDYQENHLSDYLGWEREIKSIREVGDYTWLTHAILKLISSN